jgi:hypothetical protein
MRGIDATFDEVSFDRERNTPNVLGQIVLGAVTLASMGCVAAYVMHNHPPARPDLSMARPAAAAPAAEVASNPFGEMIIEPGWVSKPTPPAGNLSLQASLEAVPPPPAAAIPLPRLDAFPPVPSAPSGTSAQPENVPLPPERDVARIEDSAPLPPPRPAEFGPFAPPAADRRVAQPSASPAPAPAESRNLFQRLFGLGQPSGPTVAPRPAAVSPPANASRPAAVSAPAVASTAPDGRLGVKSFFGFGGFGAAAPTSGYDRYTAVYDISARSVYLPDGTRLEAHSGLGYELDNPRYVSERMRGPTPPHLYELTLREASFHGVQALRLNPIGEGGLYGRAGLLAHSYMLGPNGESNGCVSFKDYQAFLRAYESGEIKRLAVVTQL